MSRSEIFSFYITCVCCVETSKKLRFESYIKKIVHNTQITLHIANSIRLVFLFFVIVFSCGLWWSQWLVNITWFLPFNRSILRFKAQCFWFQRILRYVAGWCVDRYIYLFALGKIWIIGGEVLLIMLGSMWCSMWCLRKMKSRSLQKKLHYRNLKKNQLNN